MILFRNRLSSNVSTSCPHQDGVSTRQRPGHTDNPPQTHAWNSFPLSRADWSILWLLLGGREKGTGCNVANNSKRNRPSAEGSCCSVSQRMKLRGCRDRTSTTTRKNGNVLANVSSLLVFPWGRLFKVCHESLQIHNLHVLIFPGSICAHGKRNIKEGGMLW